MNVNVTLQNWKVIEAEGVRKIAGTYLLKCGATEIAKQEFNDGYGNQTKVLFSSELMMKAEALTKEIADELTKTFTGGN